MANLFTDDTKVSHISIEPYSIKYAVIVHLENKKRYRVDLAGSESGAKKYKAFLLGELKDGRKIILCQEQEIEENKGIK